MTLKEGVYIFEISNKAIGKDNEGFVLSPKGNVEAENHTKTAFVTSLVKNNSKSTS